MGITARARRSRSYNDPMTDQDGLEADTDGLRHTLTIPEVEAQLAASGLPRSRRQVVRYCATGLFDATKIPGPTGPQWYVTPHSVTKGVGDLRELEAQRDRARRPTMSIFDALETAPNIDSDIAGYSRLERATSDLKNNVSSSQTHPDPDGHSRTATGERAGYVQQLEKRIEEKDDVIGLLKGQLTAKDQQIGDLSTRYGEMHTLVQGLQKMLAPLLGTGKPHADQPRSTETDAPMAT